MRICPEVDCYRAPILLEVDPQQLSRYAQNWQPWPYTPSRHRNDRAYRLRRITSGKQLFKNAYLLMLNRGRIEGYDADTVQW